MAILVIISLFGGVWDIRLNTMSECQAVAKEMNIPGYRPVAYCVWNG